MSFDLIKKQKAKIQKEKKKIADNQTFSHPLAYEPTPKGKGQAIREHFSSDRKGGLDLVGRKNKSKSNFSHPEKNFELSSADRNSIGLFPSRMIPFVSGKKGKHVSDVFVPHKSLADGKGKPFFVEPAFQRFGQEDKHLLDEKYDYRGVPKIKLKIDSDYQAAEINQQKKETLKEKISFTAGQKNKDKTKIKNSFVKATKPLSDIPSKIKKIKPIDFQEELTPQKTELAEKISPFENITSTPIFYQPDPEPEPIKAKSEIVSSKSKKNNLFRHNPIFRIKEKSDPEKKMPLTGKAYRIWKKVGEKKSFFRKSASGTKKSVALLTVGIFVSLAIPVVAYVQKVIDTKNQIESQSQVAYKNIDSAKSAMFSAKPEEARRNFQNAYQNFLSAGNSLNEIDGTLFSVIKVLPLGSKIKSGENLLEAGKHLSSAGQIVSEAFDVFLGDQGALKKKFLNTDNISALKEISDYQTTDSGNKKANNLTDAIVIFQEKITQAKSEMEQANGFLGNVKISDLPEDKREQFVLLQEKLPTIIKDINDFSAYTNIILSVLGHKEARQYLFLFENNDEIRATGGFIGTYGIMKINEGNVSQLYIDGIYNPDGQLKERIIPPKPIQKMSATWSMHDANWWPDFPKSAEKVAWFYEKTGGPSVDGVIAFTPKVLENLLRITGPINHEKYNQVVSADNFVELTQNQVDSEYDKTLNRPKQFLADLAPLILEKVFNSPPEKWMEILASFAGCLEDRSVVTYFFDYNVQKAASELGWTGEILNVPKDYLSVVNTNINGMKTDRMIEQKISHQAEIKPDGSVIDTVTVTRSHKGGKETASWYNAVNADWMRIYVPKGSELLSAEGYTREVNSPPVDYAKLGFVEDDMVITEESGTNIDPYTGTRVYEDSGKTVFANWTYVSPGETLTVKYTYLLPFKLRFDDLKKPADTYSLLVQKQAGDDRSWVNSEVKGLENFDMLYRYPDNLSFPDWKINQKFDKDIFAGMVLTEKGKGKELTKNQ